MFGPGGSFSPGSAAARLVSLAGQDPHTTTVQAPHPGGAPLPSTLAEFYEHNADLPSADNSMVELSLVAMGYHPGEGVLDRLAEDLKELVVDRYIAKMPPEITVRQAAATQRLLSRISAAAGVPAIPPSRLTEDSAAGLLRSVLSVAGVPADPKRAEEERQRAKATVGQLARELQIGTISPSLLPGKELLQKATTAAQLGHFLESQPELPGSDRQFARGLLSHLQ